MTPRPHRSPHFLVALLTAALASAAAGAAANAAPLELPWREAGWNERAAAAHLLDRLAYGARPGEVDRLVALGLGRWVEQQLAASLPEPVLTPKLARLPALALSAEAIVETYPPGFAVRRMAEEAGVVSKEEMAAAEAAGEPRAETRRKVYEWLRSQGLHPEQEQLAQAYARKLWGALYAENQLAERLADFWFNHFNVAISDNPVRGFLLAYERDAIRPNVLGDFRALLEATAKHPAMLLYLDNYNSIANPGQPTTLAARDGRFAGRAAMRSNRPDPNRPNRPQGLNENYARELLELHTLGVDGGYTQQDVIEVARALTGWTVFPRGGMPGAEEARRKYARAESVRGGAGGLGFVRDGMFVFRADAHDAAAKIVLGRKLPGGRGIEDGEAVLDLLAAHPSTAKHLTRKLAIRFVSDTPPEPLVERLAAVFLKSHGDLRATVRALVAAPEFWAPETRGAKIKSPFETAVSALRATGAQVDNPLATLDWIAKMGEPLYAYAAPTGYPDRADQWVNTGALLQRMNFGLELAGGRVEGVRFDLDALLDHREPESAAAAFAAWGERILPERDLEATGRQLEPLLAESELGRKLAERAPAAPGLDLDDDTFPETRARRSIDLPDSRGANGFERTGFRDRRLEWLLADLFPPGRPMARSNETPSVPASALGLLLGSPEFQRR